MLDATVRDNLVLGELGRFVARLGVVDGARRRGARERLEACERRPADLDALARGLSGGNQQKVVLARARSRERPRARSSSRTRRAASTSGRPARSTRSILAAAARATPSSS